MTCIVQEGYAKRQVCAVLGVSRASYYRRCKRQTRTVCAKRQRLRAHVKALFEASGRSYGSRRIKVALMAQDIMVGRYQIRQIMRELDIRPVWKKAFVRTTDSQHKLHEFRCSMSGKGFTEQCSSYDNAVMERFFLSLKTERVWQQHYANHQEAIRDISRYIVAFYNGVRLHSTLGYQSPNQFEQANQNLLNRLSHFA